MTRGHAGLAQNPKLCVSHISKCVLSMSQYFWNIISIRKVCFGKMFREVGSACFDMSHQNNKKSDRNRSLNKSEFNKLVDEQIAETWQPNIALWTTSHRI